MKFAPKVRDALLGRLTALRRELGANYVARLRVTSRTIKMLSVHSRYDPLDGSDDEAADVSALRKLNGKAGRGRPHYFG